jgi:hypothetical protein
MVANVPLPSFLADRRTDLTCALRPLPEDKRLGRYEVGADGRREGSQRGLLSTVTRWMREGVLGQDVDLLGQPPNRYCKAVPKVS